MKTLLKLLAVATLIYSPAPFAHDLGFLFCEAQLEVNANPQSHFYAPALVSRSADSLNNARQYGDQLTMDFNTENFTRSASVILDGRSQMVDMNTHVKVTNLEEGIRFELRDSVSGKELVEVLGPRESGSRIVLETDAASMNLKCIFSVL